MSCQEGLTASMRRFQQHKNHVSLWSLAFFLCQGESGERKIRKARCCFHLSSILSPALPFLALAVCVFLLLHLFPVSPPTSPVSPFSGQLSCLSSFCVFSLFLFLRTGSPPTLPRGLCHPCFPGQSVSRQPGLTNFSRNCLPPLSHLCLLLPQVPHTENV